MHTKGKAQVIDTNFAGLTGGEYLKGGFRARDGQVQDLQDREGHLGHPQDTSDGTLKQEFASALAQYPQGKRRRSNISDGIIIQDGFAQAIQSAGRTKTLALVGTEGYAPNIALIRAQNGEAADTPFDSNWLAWGAVDTVLRLLDHQPPCTRAWASRSSTRRTACQRPASTTRPRSVPRVDKKAWGVS